MIQQKLLRPNDDRLRRCAWMKDSASLLPLFHAAKDQLASIGVSWEQAEPFPATTDRLGNFSGEDWHRWIVSVQPSDMDDIKALSRFTISCAHRLEHMIAPGQSKTKLPTAKSQKSSTSFNRFHVALSFPGEHRSFVLKVAEALAAKLTRERVFYDEWYEADLVGSDGDLKLMSMYEQACLVVPFFSQHYSKPWCATEWETIREILLNRRKDDAVVPVHLDNTDVPGWSSVNFGIQLKGRSARQIADVIMKALAIRNPNLANAAATAMTSQSAVGPKVAARPPERAWDSFPGKTQDINTHDVTVLVYAFKHFPQLGLVTETDIEDFFHIGIPEDRRQESHSKPGSFQKLNTDKLPEADRAACLLFAGEIEAAFRESQELVRRELSFETLRLLTLSGLGGAILNPGVPDFAKHAAMSLEVLANTLDLWGQWERFDEKKRAFIDRCCDKLRDILLSTASTEFELGALSLRDFILCESESAKALGQLDSQKTVETPLGPIRLVYGYRFAVHYGRPEWKLREWALRYVKIADGNFFSPLYCYAYLSRHGREAEVVNAPPLWLRLKEHRHHKKAVELVSSCALQILENVFTIEGLPKLGETAQLSLYHLTAMRSTLDSTQNVAKIFDTAASSIYQCGFTARNLKLFEGLASLAERLLGGATVPAGLRLRHALLRQQAALSLSAGQYNEAVRLIDLIADECSLSSHELMMRFQALKGICLTEGANSKTVAKLKRTIGQWRKVSPGDDAIDDAEDVLYYLTKGKLIQGLDFDEVCEIYRSEANLENRHMFALAVRERAYSILKDEGADAAASFLGGLRRKFPDSTELMGIGPSVVEVWRFDESLSLDELNKFASIIYEEHGVDRALQYGSDVLTNSQSCSVDSKGTNQVQIITAIQNQVTSEMETTGPKAAAACLRNMTKRFSAAPDIQSLAVLLAGYWLDLFEADKVRHFLDLCEQEQLKAGHDVAATPAEKLTNYLNYLENPPDRSDEEPEDIDECR